MRANKPKPQSPPAKAVIYCRVSSAKQATQGHGLESQESRCRDHARKQNLDVAAVFPDDVSGGGGIMKRHGMVALLSFLDAQPTERFVVIFDDLKRFARNTEFHIKLRREFNRRQVRVECPNSRFEDTPEGRFSETIVAAQGELEREQNRRQVCQKMAERFKRGYWVLNAPVGLKYKLDPIHSNVMRRKEPQASIVKQALEGIANGRFGSQVEVQRSLAAQPDYPKTGGQVRS